MNFYFLLPILNIIFTSLIYPSQVLDFTEIQISLSKCPLQEEVAVQLLNVYLYFLPSNWKSNYCRKSLVIFIQDTHKNSWVVRYPQFIPVVPS